MSFNVAVFFISPSPSLTDRDDLIYWITTLTILYDSDNYVTHAYIYITFLSLSEAQ